MSNRIVRINELVQRELADILHRQYQAEAVAITVTGVEVSPDLRDGRIFVSVLGPPEVAEEKLRWLRRQREALRRELGRRITLKYLPRFDYALDTAVVRGARVLKLLDELQSPPSAP